MRKAANLVGYQLVWFAAVDSAANGHLWVGPVAALAFLGLQLWMTPRSELQGELGLVLGFALLGATLDSGLKALGLIAFPTSVGAWPEPLDWLPPGWILALWASFACLPRFSLAWMSGRYRLAALLGALGGPLSFVLGERMGAVTLHDERMLSLVALSVEYAVVTPLMLALAARVAKGMQASGDAGEGGFADPTGE